MSSDATKAAIVIKQMTASLVALCLFGVPLGAHQADAATVPSVQTIAAALTLTDPFIVTGLYRHPDRWHAGHVAPDGAAAENLTWELGTDKRWNIERQRYGADFIQGGTALHDDAMVAQGAKMLDWGWQQQQPDGSFGKDCNGGYHSITMFVEADARALILLEAYNSAQYADVIRQDKDHLRHVLAYFRQPGVTETGDATDAPFAHRRWLAAAMYAEAAVALDDTSFYPYADAKAQEGLGLQESDGTNPEKGGFDVTYQSFGMTLAYRYLQACDNPQFRAQIPAMITKGTQLLAAHIGPDGGILTDDSTRTGREKSGNGKVKGIDYRIVLQVLTYASHLTGNANDLQLAKAVAVKKGWGS